MNRTVLGLLFAVCSTAHLSSQMGNMNAPTFTKDVTPILQKRCQSCHRPGEAAPFSMLTYEETRPWAGAMKLAVQHKVMPPWYAEAHVGHFSNDRSLTQQEINTIVAWATAGAPKGDPKDMPPVLNFVEGWGIPKPDMTFHSFEETSFEPPALWLAQRQPPPAPVAARVRTDYAQDGRLVIEKSPLHSSHRSRDVECNRLV